MSIERAQQHGLRAFSDKNRAAEACPILATKASKLQPYLSWQAAKIASFSNNSWGSLVASLWANTPG